MESGKELAAFSGHETKLVNAYFTPNGKRLMTADEGGLIKIWDVVTGQELLTIKTGIEEIGSIALSPDGKIIATTSGSDATIRLLRANEIN